MDNNVRSAQDVTPQRVRAALVATAQGKSVHGTMAKVLKTLGLVGLADGRLVLTQKGRCVLETASSAGVGGDDAVQLPDTVDRLANPRNGENSLVEECDIAAARKFQIDLQRAGLRQRITQSWSLASLTNSGGNSGARGNHEPTCMLDARDRVNRACKSIGPEFSGPLIDVCLFEKSLSGVEQERRWPARSAKLVIALGLRALARHYGLTQAAVT